ncbi:hypothetical protein MIR68_007604 [Amoeboaphelidium protococcarum]|nr:hypothetical protein MIR68_007604 [Amoeboaphelidium protococcarum]KAI3642620.1 hypothetical protein MP228_012175 [Amoeboaphelidium protococcarum]KAI3645534.1 hypothetical protein MP228_008462 [Amoeboaphelidium protococcarum]
MYGDEAIKLLRELKRSGSGLKQFNGDSLKYIVQEIVKLHNDGTEILHNLQESGSQMEPSGNEMAQVNVAIESIQRNKQCILTYMHHRMKKIEQLAWQNRAESGGKKLPHKNIQQLLSPDEQTYYLDYCRLIYKYNLQYVDLMGSQVPPMSLYIRVRAVKDLSFETESGTVKIIKVGHEEHMKRSEAERYIEQGFLVQC